MDSLPLSRLTRAFFIMVGRSNEIMVSKRKDTPTDSLATDHEAHPTRTETRGGMTQNRIVELGAAFLTGIGLGVVLAVSWIILT